MSSTERPIRGTAGYSEGADALAERYESVTFADVHRDVLHLIPASRCRVLDIGAGTGRDAAALASRGHDVVAVEPTRELREHGRRLHASMPIEWVDDALPDLDVMRARGERFDLVLLTAVWMHLDREERARGMSSVAGLLAAGGLLGMSLRHGPVPEGRRMFDVSAEETTLLARTHGLEPVLVSGREDMLGRADVRWSHIVLRKAR